MDYKYMNDMPPNVFKVIHEGSFSNTWKPTEDVFEYLVKDYGRELEKLMRKEIVNMEYTFNFTPVLADSIKSQCEPNITKVIFFDRTCRVFWSDGVESEAVCMKGDTYTKEGILGIAIAKRFMGGYTPMREVLDGLKENNGNSVYIRLTPLQKADIKRQKILALRKEKRIAAEKERQEINARRKEKRMKKSEEQYKKWVAEQHATKKES